jgi:hypothetical protein
MKIKRESDDRIEAIITPEEKRIIENCLHYLCVERVPLDFRPVVGGDPEEGVEILNTLRSVS